MESRTLRNIALAVSLFMISAVTFAQRHGGGHHSGGWLPNDYQVESSAQRVAQDASMLRSQLELIDDRRGGGRHGRDGRGRYGRGLFPITNALRTVESDARQLSRSARDRVGMDFAFRQLERSFQSYKSISIAIQNNPRFSYEVRALDRSMEELRRNMRSGGGDQSGTLERAKRQSSRLSRVTSELASLVRAELTYRRYQTHAETEALRTTSELSEEAQRFASMVQMSRPALIRAKRQFPHLREHMRKTRQALRGVVTSYSVEEKLQRAGEIIRRLADTLETSGGPGHHDHGNGRNDYDFDFYSIQ